MFLYLSVIFNNSVIMNKLFTYLILPLVALISLNSFAQTGHFQCGSDERLRELYAADPKLEADQAKMLQNARQYKMVKGEKTTVYTIPIVFHIIHQYGVENISDDQVINQVAILNRDYRLLNADVSEIVPEFQNLKSDIHIEFKLATKDPYGNCTNGIDRVYSHESTNGDDNAKLNGWNRNQYLNVWVVAKMEGTVAGYAFYPSSVTGSGFLKDGVIILNGHIGSIGTGSEYNSRALTHEIGHWLGLPHTWGDNNDPGNACGDDGINDTPVTKGSSLHCNIDAAKICSVIKTDTVVYDFKNVTLTSGLSSTAVSTAKGPIFEDFKSVGLSSNSLNAGRFSFSGWPIGGAAIDGGNDYSQLNGAIDLTKYYEFKIKPHLAGNIDYKKLNFAVQRSSTGPRSFSVRSSVDNFAADLVDSTANALNLEIHSNNFFIKEDVNTKLDGTNVIIRGSSFTTVRDEITFRIYAWNAEDNLGTFSVDSLRVTCTEGIVENVQNYMEYSYCSRMFTIDQAAVMRLNLLADVSGRSNLITPENHAATGIDVLSPVTCIPVADFKSDLILTSISDVTTNSYSICQGGTVSFTDVSWNAPVTSRVWTFEGGTPATSTSANVSVTYATSGYKKVSLTVTNAAGTNTKTVDKYIFVSDPWGDYYGPAKNTLDDNKIYWFLNQNSDEDDNKFEIVDGKGVDKSKCYELKNYRLVNYNDPYSKDLWYVRRLGGSRDAIITPSYDLSHTTNANLSFDYSYATNGTQLTTVGTNKADILEKINVYVSRNCGETWSNKKTISGKDLLTAGFAGGSDYSPTTASQWKNIVIPYSGSMTDYNVRFKIEFIASDVSNNLFIDNINVGGVLGLFENELSNLELNVYPNPLTSEQSLNVSYTAGENPVILTLRDVQGKVIYTEKIDKTNTQVNHSLALNSKLNSACYFLEVKSGAYSTIKKVVVL